MEWITLPWPDPQLAILQRPCRRVHARVYSQDAPQVQSPQANNNAAIPLCSYKTKLRRTIQLTVPEDTSELLTPKDVKRLQQVICSLLFYGRSIDSSLLVETGTLASAQTKATINTGQALTKLLNYCASNIDTAICFHACIMVMYAAIDASYLSEPKE